VKTRPDVAPRRGEVCIKLRRGRKKYAKYTCAHDSPALAVVRSPRPAARNSWLGAHALNHAIFILPVADAIGKGRL
jgi:transposase